MLLRHPLGLVLHTGARQDITVTMRCNNLWLYNQTFVHYVWVFRLFTKTHAHFWGGWYYRMILQCRKITSGYTARHLGIMHLILLILVFWLKVKVSKVRKYMFHLLEGEEEDIVSSLEQYDKGNHSTRRPEIYNLLLAPQSGALIISTAKRCS